MDNKSDDPKRTTWHARTAEEALAALDTHLDGLSEQEANERLQRFGRNQLSPIKKRGPLLRFFAQFNNLLIYVLLAAAAMTAALAHWIDMGVILAVVVINALIGFIQEGKAERALEAIQGMLSPQALVRRNGTLEQIPAEELVPGDVIALQSGDKVPADVRLLRAKELRIDESLLTGESVPVSKGIEPVAEDVPIGDRACVAYSGTLVTYGQAQALVVATGDATEIGRISGMLAGVETLTTPLLRQMAQFGQWLSVAIVGIAALTFVYGVWVRDYSAAEMFLAAVGLVVAAIPEGLPAIMTITLAIGVQQMARRHAIIRRLPAVETLGAVTVICSDKTGTLTRNEMTVQSVATASGFFEVSGVGYDPHGEFRLDGRPVDIEAYPILEEVARASLMCNDAEIRVRDGQWQLHGDPTEGALITLALKARLDPARQHAEWPRTDVIPFESEHRFMATLHHDHAGHGFVYIKGATERVLQMCTYQRMRGEDVALDEFYWHDQMRQMAARGQRVLAIAWLPTGDDHQELRFSDVHEGVTLLGLVGIMDPPRQEAIAAVQECHSAGIRVKMITGDHAATATAIGASMGIGDGHTALSGPELEALEAENLPQKVRDVDVFARVSPEQKLQLVTALQSDGEVAAMTGDGVNDAPALKRADVGIAMGQKGTEVAKEAAEMVLADDNFASIAHAVEEGRTVYDNLKKAIIFILPTNGGEAFTLIAAILMGRALPITPVQILWVNMVTAVTLALTLAFEASEADVMRRRPRDPGEPILSRFMVWRILFVSAILVAGTFGLFLWERAGGASEAMARTVAVNTLVMFEIFYLFNARYLIASSVTVAGIFGNRYALWAVAILLVLQIAFTYWSPMQALFDTKALSGLQWVTIIAVAFSVFVLVEIEKAMVRLIVARRSRIGARGEPA